MTKQNIKPFISVLVFISSLFLIVFFKMDVRRMGYSILRLAKYEKTIADQNRILNLHFAQLSRPGRIEHLAESKLALAKPHTGQIVQMSGDLFMLHQ